jgi:hypothetical protein
MNCQREMDPKSRVGAVGTHLCIWFHIKYKTDKFIVKGLILRNTGLSLAIGKEHGYERAPGVLVIYFFNVIFPKVDSITVFHRSESRQITMDTHHNFLFPSI